jgi:hypothetical protein
MLPPPAEQFMAQRINARFISLPTSHVSMVSHPKEVADFILNAADQLTESAVKEPAMHE